MTRRRFWHGALSGLLFTGVVACGTERLTIPNYNQPTTEGLSKDPSAVQLLASGLLEGRDLDRDVAEKRRAHLDKRLSAVADLEREPDPRAGG